MGERKILRRFPFTDEGWQQAWRFLVGSDPVQAQRVRAELEEREVQDRAAVRLADLDSLAMAKLPAVKLLGGYAPNIDIAPDAHYDIRFLPERLVVTPAGTDEILIDLLYGDVEGVDIGGPGERFACQIVLGRTEAAALPCRSSASRLAASTFEE